MIEKYYTPEQRGRLAERKRELGVEAIEQTQRDWAELIAAVKTERERGTDPTGPTMQTLAGRWRELIGRFTGGDEGIRGSVQEMYRKEGAQSASRGAFDDELMEYIGRALAAGR